MRRVADDRVIAGSVSGRGPHRAADDCGDGASWIGSVPDEVFPDAMLVAACWRAKGSSLGAYARWCTTSRDGVAFTRSCGRIYGEAIGTRAHGAVGHRLEPIGTGRPVSYPQPSGISGVEPSTAERGTRQDVESARQSWRRGETP